MTCQMLCWFAGNATVSVGPSAQKVGQQDNGFHSSFAQDNSNSLI